MGLFTIEYQLTSHKILIVQVLKMHIKCTYSTNNEANLQSESNWNDYK